MAKALLHHIPSSRSMRILWLLEELGVDYDLVVHPFVGAKPPTDLNEYSPLAKAPILEIDGHTLVESGAITRYLLSRSSKAGVESTRDGEKRQDSVFWAQLAEGNLSLYAQNGVMLTRLVPGLRKRAASAEEAAGVAKLGDAIQANANDNLKKSLGEVEQFLKTHDYFTGTDEVGEGDFMMVFPVQMMVNGFLKNVYPTGPATAQWVARIQARPGWQRAKQREKKAMAEWKAKAKL